MGGNLDLRILAKATLLRWAHPRTVGREWTMYRSKHDSHCQERSRR
jgi:hypothetical protein